MAARLLSNLSLFSNLKSIVNLGAEIAYCGFELSRPKKQLN